MEIVQSLVRGQDIKIKLLNLNEPQEISVLHHHRVHHRRHQSVRGRRGEERKDMMVKNGEEVCRQE